MATGTIPLILPGNLDASNPPQLLFSTARRPYLAFDQSTDEKTVWAFRMPQDYSSTLVAKIVWSGSSSTTTSHTCRWSIEIMAVTPESDSVATESDSYDTANTVDDDILGTTAKRPQEASTSLTNVDSIAANDLVSIRLSRNASHANDDLNEDAWLWAACLEYTTT